MRTLNRFMLFSMLLTGLILVSCKKKNLPEPETSPTPNNNITDTTTNYYLSAEIDGNPWLTGDTTTLTNFGVRHFNGWNFDPISTATLMMDYLGCFIPENAVNVNDYANGQMVVSLSGYSYSPYNNSTFEIDCNAFQASLANPPTSFYSSLTPNQVGFEIIYLDTIAGKWSSKFGDQTGSDFTITYNNMTNPLTNYQTCARKYRGTFSCKVYKESDPSQFKVITNGKFHAHISKYNE